VGSVIVNRVFINIKACPRCKGGDILIDRAFEDSEVCLQCGFRGGVIPAHLAHLLYRKEKKRDYEVEELDKVILNSQ